MSKHRIVWSDLKQDKQKYQNGKTNNIGDNNQYDKTIHIKKNNQFNQHQSDLENKSSKIENKQKLRELQDLIDKSAKSMFVKSLITNEHCGASWLDIHDSQEETERKHREHQGVINDYHKYHDWEYDAEYQKAMQMPSDELMKYGLKGKEGQEELDKEQEKYDYEIDHPIASYLHMFKFF